MSDLRILVAGRPGSGQKEAVEALTRQRHSPDSWAGHVITHEFNFKYLGAVPSHIWTDEFEDARAWVADFTSDEAAEVRQAVGIVIYTFDTEVDEDMALFVASLPRDRVNTAVYAMPLNTCSDTHQELLESMGLDVIERDGILDQLGGIVYDVRAQSDGDNASNDDSDDDSASGADDGDAGDIDGILDQLREARISKTMTPEEKLKLADRLARQLVP